MLARISRGDRVCGAAALLGIVAAFLPWYMSTSGTVALHVNGFRASLFGDLFFVGMALMLVVVLHRAEIIRLPLPFSEVALNRVALSLLIAEMLLLLVTGTTRTPQIGLWGAVAAAMGMAIGTFLTQQDAMQASLPRPLIHEYERM